MSWELKIRDTKIPVLWGSHDTKLFFCCVQKTCFVSNNNQISSLPVTFNNSTIFKLLADNSVNWNVFTCNSGIYSLFGWIMNFVHFHFSITVWLIHCKVWRKPVYQNTLIWWYFKTFFTLHRTINNIFML